MGGPINYMMMIKLIIVCLMGEIVRASDSVARGAPAEHPVSVPLESLASPRNTPEEKTPEDKNLPPQDLGAPQGNANDINLEVAPLEVQDEQTASCFNTVIEEMQPPRIFKNS